MNTKIDIQKLPQPPTNAAFSLVKVDTISQPHPYCISSRLVAYAANHFNGMLSAAAIQDAEKHGIHCDICRAQAHKGERILSYEEHESITTLFVRVPHYDLNSIPGLHKYLFDNKTTFETAGIQGFAFPK